MSKQGLVKHSWLLAGIILGIFLVSFGILSQFSGESRFEQLPALANPLNSVDPNTGPFVSSGAELSVELHAWIFPIPSSIDPSQLDVAGEGIQADQVLWQMSPHEVEREVCIANTGNRETRGLSIQDLIEVEETAGVFKPVPGMKLDVPVTRELYPRERWCHVGRISFLAGPGPRHRLTTIVSITNHIDYLPGSPQCPSVEGCPYEKVVSTVVQVPMIEALASTSTPTSAATLQPSSTPTARAAFIGIVSAPASDPPDPPAQAPPQQPQDTPIPQPTQPPSNPDPTEEPDPTEPPDDDDDEDNGGDDDDRDDDDDRGGDDDDDDEDDDDDDEDDND